MSVTPEKTVHMLSFHSYHPKDVAGVYVYRREDNTVVFPNHTDIIPTLFKSGEEPPNLPLPVQDRCKSECNFNDVIKARYHAVYIITGEDDTEYGRSYSGPKFLTYPYTVDPTKKPGNGKKHVFTYVTGRCQNPKAFLFDRTSGQVYFHKAEPSIWSMFCIPSISGFSSRPSSTIEHVEVIVDQPKPTNEYVDQVAAQANIRAIFLVYNTTKQQFTDIYVNEPYYRWRKASEGDRKRKMREPASYVKRVGYTKDEHGVEQLPFTDVEFTREVTFSQHCEAIKHLAIEYACWDLIRARDTPLDGYFTTFPNTMYSIAKLSRAIMDRKEMKDNVTDDIVML